MITLTASPRQKTEVTIGTGISAINTSAQSCDRCGSFTTIGNLIGTSHPIMKRVCPACASKYPHTLSAAGHIKLRKLLETARY